MTDWDSGGADEEYADPGPYSCVAEREYAERHGPAAHRATSRLIHDLMTLPDLLPNARCNCDEGHACRMHQFASELIDNAHRTGRPERARGAIERFARRLGK